MNLRFLLYAFLVAAAVACFGAGQWAGALTAFTLLLILMVLDRIQAALIRIADQLDYNKRAVQTPQTTIIPRNPQDAMDT